MNAIRFIISCVCVFLTMLNGVKGADSGKGIAPQSESIFQEYETTFSHSYFLIGDFNGWQLPEENDYHEAIRMKTFVPIGGLIGPGHYEVSGINLNSLGKFVVYCPSGAFVGFDPTIEPDGYEREGVTYNRYGYYVESMLDEVIPFEVVNDKEEYEDNTFTMLTTPFAVIIANGSLSTTLLDMVGVDDVASEDLAEVARYTLDGVAVDASYKGFVIVRYAGGSARKVVVK